MNHGSPPVLKLSNWARKTPFSITMRSFIFVLGGLATIGTAAPYRGGNSTSAVKVSGLDVMLISNSQFDQRKRYMFLSMRTSITKASVLSLVKQMSIN